jgi:hypothetical protein
MKFASLKMGLLFLSASRIDFVLPAKLRFENRSNKKTLK